MNLSGNRKRYRSDANLVRAAAYHSTRMRLNAGDVTLAEAVIALREAYRRAARIERGQAPEDVAA